MKHKTDSIPFPIKQTMSLWVHITYKWILMKRVIFKPPSKTRHERIDESRKIIQSALKTAMPQMLDEEPEKDKDKLWYKAVTYFGYALWIYLALVYPLQLTILLVAGKSINIVSIAILSTLYVEDRYEWGSRIGERSPMMTFIVGSIVYLGCAAGIFITLYRYFSI
jgi:hypothetical protein